MCTAGTHALERDRDSVKRTSMKKGAKLNNKAPIRDPYEARAMAGDSEVERSERRD
jgi:hypothetical protein